jgi:hypothetical protein
LFTSAYLPEPAAAPSRAMPRFALRSSSGLTIHRGPDAKIARLDSACREGGLERRTPAEERVFRRMTSARKSEPLQGNARAGHREEQPASHAFLRSVQGGAEAGARGSQSPGD